ncbi:MAG TPA: hypothetical protein VIJ34_13835, partial [Acidimicrobiales bacterium]
MRQNRGSRFSIVARAGEHLADARVGFGTHRRSEWPGQPAIATASSGHLLGAFLDWPSVLEPDRRIRVARRKGVVGRSHRPVDVTSICSRGTSAVVVVLLSIALMAGVLSVQSGTGITARTSPNATHTSITKGATSSADAAKSLKATLERAVRRTLGRATGGALLAGGASFRDVYAHGGADLRAPGFTIGIGRAAIGRGRSIRPIASKLVTDGRGATYRADGLVESYLASPSGVEQSFKLATRPGGRGPLVIDV